MWKLRKKFTFEAAHQLPHHDGKCQRLHGHSWVGWLVIEGSNIFSEGPKSGMVMDYADVSAVLKPLVAQYLDHHHLNETLGMESPTSEQIAKWAFEKLYPMFDGYLAAVIIEETCTCSCEYRP